MASVYTKTPWNVRVPASSEVSSPTPNSGLLWIVRWMSGVVPSGTGAFMTVRAPQNAFAYKFIPTSTSEGWTLDCRIVVNSGQVMKVQAGTTAVDVVMTVYEFPVN